MIFSDEDTIRSNGTRSRPWFKSDWNPALMLSQNAVGRLGACSRDLVSRLGGFRAGYEGAEEYELILRSARATDPIRIRHIPRVLYHRSAARAGWQTQRNLVARRSGVRWANTSQRKD